MLGIQFPSRMSASNLLLLIRVLSTLIEVRDVQGCGIIKVALEIKIRSWSNLSDLAGI